MTHSHHAAHRRPRPWALIGMKHCGKTTTGRLLASLSGRVFLDLDELIRSCFAAENRIETAPSVREIYREHGREEFQRYERAAADEFARRTSTHQGACVLACGGGVVENKPAIERLAAISVVVYLDDDPDVLFERVVAGGIPAFLDSADPHAAFTALWAARDPLYRAYAEQVVKISGQSPEQLASKLYTVMQEYGDVR